jgi:hypothetical protein
VFEDVPRPEVERVTTILHDVEIRRQRCERLHDGVVQVEAEPPEIFSLRVRYFVRLSAV